MFIPQWHFEFRYLDRHWDWFEWYSSASPFAEILSDDCRLAFRICSQFRIKVDIKYVFFLRTHTKIIYTVAVYVLSTVLTSGIKRIRVHHKYTTFPTKAFGVDLVICKPLALLHLTDICLKMLLLLYWHYFSRCHLGIFLSSTPGNRNVWITSDVQWKSVK